MRLAESFAIRVWALLKKIPRGKVSTYKQVAIALGNPNAARAVGNACRRNSNAPKVPCHRVVRSDGCIGGYSKGVKKKVGLLEKEGIEVNNGRIKNFQKSFSNFEKC